MGSEDNSDDEVSSQPGRYKRSYSQPLSGEAAKSTKLRRIITSPRQSAAYRDDGIALYLDHLGFAQLSDDPVDSIKQFQKAIFKILCARLAANRIASADLKEELFRWCLPKS